MTSKNISRSWQAICMGLLLIVLPGCGGCGGGLSQDDLMRAAMRDTSSDEEKEDESKDANESVVSAISEDNQSNENDAGTSSPDATVASQRNRVNEPNSVGSTSTTTTETNLASNSDTSTSVRNNQTSSVGPVDANYEPVATVEERRERSIENMNAIAKGITAFANEKKYLPSPAINDKSGNPGLSWRVSILPHLGYQTLYDQFRLDEPWDSEHNAALVNKIPPCFQDPERGDGYTAYLIPVHRKSAFPAGGRPVRTARIEDGLANTVILVEVDEAAMVPWTKPADLMIDQNNPTLQLGGRYVDGFFAAWGSNRIARIVPSIAPQVLFGLFTVDGGESFERDLVSSEATVQVAGDVALNGSPEPLDVANNEAASDSRRQDSGSGVTSCDLDSASNTDTIEHSNSFSTGNIPAMNQTELAYASLREGREYEAFQNQYVALLLTDPKEVTRSFSWVPALNRPVLAMRWGIGLDAVVPPQFNDDFAPIINRDRVDRWVSGNPGEAGTQKYTGELGLRLLSMLRKRQDAGKYGTFVNLAAPEEDLRQRPVVARRNVNAGEFAPEHHYAGIHILGVGSRRVLTHVARRCAVDVLVIFDLEIKATRYNQIHNTTTIHFINAQTGEEIYESMKLNNIRVFRDREDRLKDDPVIEFFDRIEEVLDTELVTQDLPSIRPEDAKERIAEMVKNPPENPLASMAEVHFYLGKGVISEFEYRDACQKISQQEEASILVEGSIYEKRDFLEQWINNGPEE